MTDNINVMPYQEVIPEPKPKKPGNETQDGPQLPVPPEEPK